MAWARSQLNASAMLPSARVRAVLSAVIPALLLASLAVWEIVATARAPHQVPGDAAWSEAAAAVRERFAPGDLIVFAPGWVDPVGRLHLGDLIPIEAAARMDAARFAVIWELSIRGARAPETAALAPTWQAGFGGVTVRRFEQAPAVVLADLVALAPTIAVRGERARGPAVVLAEVGFAPRRCVQIEPRPGQAVTLDYGQVTLGSQLVGAVGLADVFTRRDVRDPGQLELRIDGAAVATVRVGVDDGWRRFTAATTPGPHHLEVVATAIGPRSRDRLICFAAEARQ
jgi:hypothetical protein